MKIMMTQFLLILLCSALAISTAFAIEPDYYPIVEPDDYPLEKSNQARELWKFEKNANRKIFYRYHTDGTIVIGTKPHGKLLFHFTYGSDKYFELEDILQISKNEKHKESLVVWFEQSIMWTDTVGNVLNNLVPKLKMTGFKRILILGAHCCGVYLLGDIKKGFDDKVIKFADEKKSFTEKRKSYTEGILEQYIGND